ncbi:hypothetical protein BT96DRAFT_1004404 [Gymnopus androsaceus JB14]|uniref:Chromo domain-containing protein n=1 Tax=Gymnopus androsaceus JB14 TaxID=1447944 RepID=A0A6A4GR14_9AGAR|nr:hypothetical protein BT96DRAFT_1004404 [Gymnopus androsaceus JB14]
MQETPECDPKPSKDTGTVGSEILIGYHTYHDFEVEAVVDHEFMQGSYLFLLKFRGWPVDRNVNWYNESELLDCQEILDTYRETHQLIPSASEYPDSDFTMLETLFDEHNLRGQFDKLKELCHSFPSGQQAFKTKDSMQKVIAAYISTNKQQYTLTNLIQSDPLHNSLIFGGSLPDCNQTIDWIFERVFTAFEVISQVQQSAYVFQIWDASVRWQHCRAILIIHDFIL